MAPRGAWGVSPPLNFLRVPSDGSSNRLNRHSVQGLRRFPDNLGSTKKKNQYRYRPIPKSIGIGRYRKVSASVSADTEKHLYRYGLLPKSIGIAQYRDFSDMSSNISKAIVSVYLEKK